MNKFKTLQSVYWSKSIIFATILFSLIALSGNFATALGQTSSAWNFRQVRVFNKLDKDGTILKERADKKGGTVDLLIKGEADGLCPGGEERIRFEWTFDQNMPQVVAGQGLSATLATKPLAPHVRPCGGAQTASSSINMYGSDGQATPFSAAETTTIDGSRFHSGGGFWANPNQPKTDITAVRVRNDELRPKMIYAWFSINLNTPAGMIYYVYIFEVSSKTSGGSSGGNNVSMEYDTDRPGADYSNYDLPRADVQLCRNACAGDANCKAYTYVKPGVQGSSARCWLKSSIPPAGKSSCCISGTKP